MKSSLTVTHRGVCGRAVSCWDISSAVANGDVTFDRKKLTEGTVAAINCDSGYTLKGASSLRCVGGMWDDTLPTCTQNSDRYEPLSLVSCWDISSAVANGDVTFDRKKLTEGTVATINCDSGYTLKGASSLRCVGGNWDKTLPSCTQNRVTCWDISSAVANGDVTFDRKKLREGTVATINCDSGYTLKGASSLRCVGGNWDTTLPTCTQDSDEPLAFITW
ncbi:hypothetical protein ACHWQZ_G008513 [Mnemiopsis leidyi]